MGETTPNAEQISLWQPLKIREFRLLFIGESVSLLGDQFYLVALPWLTLQITGSGMSLGGVLMAVAIPRAILMLIGGVLSDRVSPRWIMLASNVLRAGLTTILALLVLFQATQLWQLYLLAISFGIVEGFFNPAAETIIPTLVPEELLITSNVLGQGVMQMTSLIGPALAGALIASLGIGVAFVVDAVSFVVSTVSLLLIRTKSSSTIAAPNSQPAIHLSLRNRIKGLITGISEGLNYCWQHRSLRIILLVLTVLNFLLMGPLQVGIPALAYERFAADPIALGSMTSAWGAGGLIGTLTPQWLPQLPRLGVLMLILASIQAAGMVTLGFIPVMLISSLVIAILGWCSSFFVVAGTTWIQTIAPPEILGRVMSITMLSSLGITPFSYAMAGLVANSSLVLLFSGTGGIMLAVLGLLALNRDIRTIE
jgi:hypothetical protein